MCYQARQPEGFKGAQAEVYTALWFRYRRPNVGTVSEQSKAAAKKANRSS